jgi:phytoene synthase
MSVSIEDSYELCRKVARARAKNFYYSFALLQRKQRDAMCALYTFNRICDDISDEPERHGYESPRKAIEHWSAELDTTLDGRCGEHACWPAFRDTVERFEIPHGYFRDMIAGVSSDLEVRTITTFDDLYRYCYQVASAVGLSAIHVFGFESEEALPLAEKCGIAFQLTNILRDVREDAEMGRVYLPKEDLDRFGVDPGWFREAVMRPQFVNLMRFEAERARGYYRACAGLPGLVRPESRGSLWALIRIYWRLLERIESSGYSVLGRRIRVPSWEKTLIFLRGMAGGSSLR